MFQNKNQKNEQLEKKFKNWTFTFTKCVILLITIVWVVMTIYEAVMIYVAVDTIQNFSYLDTFIIEVNKAFCVIVGVNLVSKTVENVFRYNDIGGKSSYPEDINIDTSELEIDDVESEDAVG